MTYNSADKDKYTLYSDVAKKVPQVYDGEEVTSIDERDGYCYVYKKMWFYPRPGVKRTVHKKFLVMPDGYEKEVAYD